MSVPPPINTRLAHAMMAARVGYAAPPAMGDGPRGRLFERRMQDAITERLAPAALDHYRGLRDGVRVAVALAAGGDAVAARAEFAACEQALDAAPAGAGGVIDALGRSWIDQAYAYHAAREGDLATAAARLEAAAAADLALETRHGFPLMHIGRVHTVHLWLRVRFRQGGRGDALDAAEAVLAYLQGARDDLPIGGGWSRAAAAGIDPDLRVAMSCRIASECGAMLADMAPPAAGAALERLPSLATTGLAEIGEWVALKRAWAAGDSEGFLCAAAGFLRAGRRDTSLWYAALIDLCRAAGALRPAATAAFRAEIAERVCADPEGGDVLPSGLRAAFRVRPSPAAPAYLHRPAPRRFHLICVGLPRSGTTSLNTLFARHRAGNEYAEAESIRRLTARAEGELDTAGIDAFLLRRDREAALEMDATSFLHLALDRLVALHPEARFVLPVRAPLPWVESYLRMLLRWHDAFAGRGRPPALWMTRYGALLFERFDWAEIATPAGRARHLPDLVPRMLRHWADATERTLRLAPPARTLVVPTEDLSRALPRLAAFAGVPLDSLTGEHHANASPPDPSPLAGLDRGWLGVEAARICGAVRFRVRGELECA